MTDSVNYTGRKKQGLAIACLILGILSIVFSEIVIGVLFGLIGLILGIVRFFQRPEKRGMLFTGLGLSVLGIIASSFFCYIWVYEIIPTFKQAFQQGQRQHSFNSASLQTLPGPPLLDFSTMTPAFILQKVWDQPISGGESLAIGDWNIDKNTDIEVSINASALKVFSMSGKEIGNYQLPGYFTDIEYGLLRPGQPVILGKAAGFQSVEVIDSKGKKLWSYGSFSGICGARWGDLYGNGISEMVVGLGGFSGLHVLNGNGKLIWKDTSIGNVWTQAVISATTNHPATILATEAGGTIHLFDAFGHPINTLHPMDEYISSFEAADIDGNNNIQIACKVDEVGQSQTVYFVTDTAENIFWKCEVQISQRQAPTNRLFAHGDLDGDGIQDWAFLRKPDELVVISGKGQLLVQMPVTSLTKQFAIITRPGKPGLLCVLEVTHLMVYEIKSKI